MVATGCNARRMFDLIELKLCQRLTWHHASPVTSNDSHLSCPIAPLFVQCRRRVAAGFCAVEFGNCRSEYVIADFFDAAPWQKRKCNGCWGRENGLIGHLLTMWPLNKPFPFARRAGCYPSTAASRHLRSLFKKLISRVTTPIPKGAFFRNEGGSLSPFLPRMEEGTQGVSPSFKEEVAWGSGWFPSPA
jgi:hypothetical protein